LFGEILVFLNIEQNYYFLTKGSINPHIVCSVEQTTEPVLNLDTDRLANPDAICSNVDSERVDFIRYF